MLSRSTVLIVLLAAAVACDKVPLGAPGGSSITLTVASSSVALNGSTEVTAFVSEASGTPVQNGTTVRFTTTLGTVEPVEAQTRNGAATTTLRAGTVSGVALVRATSGASTGGSGTPTNAAQIRIGAAAAGSVTVSATPSSVPPSGGTVAITAAVIDASGNRLRAVPVSFSTSAGTLSAPTATTSDNGEASVQLTTDRTATVTARLTGGGGADSGITEITGQVTVNVAAGNVLAVSVSPATTTVGSAVVATVTPTIGANNVAPRVTINWGDGNQDDLGTLSAARTVAHAYSATGTFVVTATGSDGASGSATVVVNQRPAISVTIATTPASPTQNTTTTFTATVTGDNTASVQSYRWQFDGSGISGSSDFVTTGNTTSKVFTASGVKTVTVTATTTDGRVGVGMIQFNVP